MSLETLNNMGFLRDKDEWGGKVQRSAVSRPVTVVAALLGAGGCVAMAVGNGGALTWLGLLAYFAGLFSFIAASLRGVKRGR